MSDIKQVLEAVSTALGVIKTIADTPGLNVLPYVSVVSSAIGAIQAAAGVGINVIPYVQKLQATFAGGTPSQADIDDLQRQIEELESLVDAALPPKEPGEPD